MPVWVILLSIQVALLLLAVILVLWFMYRKDDPLADLEKDLEEKKSDTQTT